MKKIILAFIILISYKLAFSQAADKLFLTIYNQDLALVREVRSLDFKKGMFEIKFRDVAARIDATSVHFKTLKFPEQVTILEQNYQFDLVSSEKILEKYIDKTIQLITKQDKEYKGELLSFDGGGLTLKDQNGAIRIISRAEVRDLFFPALPEGLITRPTLVWQLDSDISGKQDAEVSYLTSGINWHSEYVAVTDKDDKNIELSGWVSIDNRSGATYSNAKLKLIAGDVHRVEEEVRKVLAYEAAALDAKRGVPFEEKAFFEYHMYTLSRPATVKDKEIKQLTLFPSTTVKAQKIFTYDGARDGGKVRVNLEFLNSEKEGLGIPLPKGKVRVYKEDVDKSQEFLGEDLIDHTPRDEKVRLYVGNAFDIVGERIQTDYKRISDDVQKYSFQISLRNHKDEKAEVVVIEHLSYGGDWEILSSNYDYVKKDAFTIEFKIPLEKNSEKKLNYTVQYVR